MKDKPVVYYADARCSLQVNLQRKLQELWCRLEGDKVIPAGKHVAVKLHFGEAGNAAYVHPTYVRTIVDLIRGAGGQPFLTDTNTIYNGSRSDGASHLECATRNGFAYSVVNAPVIIADGLKGTNTVTVPVDGKHFSEVELGADAVEAEAMVVITHFKGHEVAGFGGTLKNIGMGLASKRTKLRMHSSVAPKIKADACTGCGQCAAACRTSAISLTTGVAVIDGEKCTGCGQCIMACPDHVVGLEWNGNPADIQEQMVEVARGALEGKTGRVLFFNFLLNISPDCDCYGFNDTPIVANIGIMASTDPVALDQAGYDMVTAAPGNPDCRKPAGVGEDKFRALFPGINGELQLAHGEKMGLGTRHYTLERIHV